MWHEKTTHAAKGKWRGILLELGMPESFLKNKHGPCPICGGQDRFRWDNKDQSGSYICGQCGAGDGMKLAMEYTGRTFAEIASEIDRLLGNIKIDTPAAPVMDETKRRDALRSVYKATRPIAPGDLAHKYLTARGVEEKLYPDALRFAPSLPDGDGGVRPCMVAMIVGVDGKPVSMHRTFLRADGMAKAEMASPRKMMPGSIPDGACVRLSDYAGGPLGVAEGIETAMSASALYDMPVWAALNTSILKKWQPPAGCDEVSIFADNDANFAGQAAAYCLANRLARAADVTVHVPHVVGDDWNDYLIREWKAA